MHQAIPGFGQFGVDAKGGFEVGGGFVELSLGVEHACERALGGVVFGFQGHGLAGPFFGSRKIAAQHVRVGAVEAGLSAVALRVGGVLQAVSGLRVSAVQGVECAQALVHIAEFGCQLDGFAIASDGFLVLVLLVVDGAEIAVGFGRSRL